jgi:thiamine biosynthesis lipoprotein
MEQAFSDLAEVDALMSEWRDDSPVSAINAAAGKRLVDVPDEVRAIIKRAIVFGDLTGGAFDITWRALDPFWQFDENFRIPDSREVEEALALVDYQRIEIVGTQIGLPKPGMSLGLGGIAKGYAIDRAGAVLKANGYENYLVNGGGDVLTAGTRAGRPWRIGVRSPRGKRNELIARLSVAGAAVVTSGDYERFKIVDGVRFHHILDPRTGYPAQECRSVTVVAPTAEEADVLATAVFVLGPSKGLQLVSARPGTEVFVIDRNGKFWMTSGFRPMAEFY